MTCAFQQFTGHQPCVYWICSRQCRISCDRRLLGGHYSARFRFNSHHVTTRATAAVIDSGTVPVVGSELEVLKCVATGDSKMPPVLGASPKPDNVQPGQPAGTLLSHSEDVATVLRTLPGAAVVVGHSFGGILIQKYLELSAGDPEAFPPVQAAAFMASTPPTGAAVMRYFLNAPILTVKVTVSLIVKDYLDNIDAMRSLFFSQQTDKAALSRFQKLLNDYSTPMLLLDLNQLREELPLAPLAAPQVPPALVLGSDTDPLVDVTDVEVLGKHVHAGIVKVIPGSGHDVMLDWRWRDFASELVTFLKSL